MDALDFLRMLTESEYERKVRDFYDDNFDSSTVISNYGDLTKKNNGFADIILGIDETEEEYDDEKE